MLNFAEKIEILKEYLSEIKDNYADSFKTDIMLYFNEIEDVVGARMIYAKTNINVVSEYLDFILSRI